MGFFMLDEGLFWAVLSLDNVDIVAACRGYSVLHRPCMPGVAVACYMLGPLLTGEQLLWEALIGTPACPPGGKDGSYTCGMWYGI